MARLSSAPSVGSPASVQPATSSWARRASLHSRAQRASPSNRASRCGIDDLAVAMETAFRRVAGAAHFERGIGQEQAHRGHFVARQGAGLVGADHRHRAQRLHRRQAAHDGTAAGHHRGADGERDGDDGGQALGYCRHRQPDHGEEDVQRRHADRVAAVEESEQSDAEDEERDLARELVEPTGERRGETGDLAHHSADAPDLGAAASRHHHAAPLTGADGGAGIGHAGAVADRRVLRHRGGALFHVQRLAGERRLADAQVARLDEA